MGLFKSALKAATSNIAEAAKEKMMTAAEGITANELKEKTLSAAKSMIESGSEAFNAKMKQITENARAAETGTADNGAKAQFVSSEVVRSNVSQGAAEPVVSPCPPPAPVFSYHAMIEGVQRGPYNYEQFKRLVDAEMVTSKTLVWCDGMSSWKKASEVDDMVDFFPSNSPMMPPLPSQETCPPPLPTQNGGSCPPPLPL
ncbi:MAG: DUF4339 domain-containing protein [Bacteroidaceae bacterium]|nr:DUF4339 domain-containing protein [Bacteroidaceae bacterium]